MEGRGGEVRGAGEGREGERVVGNMPKNPCLEMYRQDICDTIDDWFGKLVERNLKVLESYFSFYF